MRDEAIEAVSLDGQSTSVSTRKTFAEFFAGIGLVRAALRKSGWHCVYANDIDPKKQEIYEANFPRAEEFDQRDVWDTQGVLARLKAAPFLATASFPCIDLSLAGDYRGLDGKHSSTFFGFTKVMSGLCPKPALLLFENVIGFLSAGNGKDFRRAVTEISELGYRVDSFILNAQSFLPQSRPRVFIVGVHETVRSGLVIDKPANPGFGDPWYLEIDRTRNLRPPVLLQLIEDIPLRTGWVATPIRPPVQMKYDLKSVIDCDGTQEWWDKEELEKHYEMLNDGHRAIIDRCIRERENFLGTGYRRKREGRVRLEVRSDGIAGCLRTPSGGSGRQIVVLVESGVLRMRWMTSREYSRLQGAGGFTFVGSERQMLFGFGDAVCVPVIEWIDKCVLSPIFSSLQDLYPEKIREYVREN